MAERTDVDLMLAFQKGDESAFSALIERHRNTVVNLAYRYVGNRQDAEDLAQEIFIKGYRARDRYQPAAKFTTWLYRVAVNASLNEVRNRKHRPTFRAASLHAAPDGEAALPVVEDVDSVSPLEAVEQSELHREVRRAVDALPERQRLALLLNKFHGLSYEELAETFELSVQAVKSLLTRARQNVRRMIEPYLNPNAEPAPGQKESA